MFRRTIINWNKLLHASIINIFTTYDISKGILTLDDTDNKRSKNTDRIHYAHKIKDKERAKAVIETVEELLSMINP